MRITGGPADSTPPTDFERSSHAELCGMLVGSSPGNVLAVGDTLTRAGAQIQSLADDLARQLAGLQWSGAAADAFTGWARQLISATDTLAVYAGHTGAAVTLAGAQLSSTRAAMPPVPAHDVATVAAFKRQQQAPPGGITLSGRTAVPPGGITQQQALQAESNIQASYQEALHQMERLGSTYLTAAATLTTTPAPTFPPLPTTLMPPKNSGFADSGENSAPRTGLGRGVESPCGSGQFQVAGAHAREGTATSSAVGPSGWVPLQMRPQHVGGREPGSRTTLQGIRPLLPAPVPTAPTRSESSGMEPGAGGVVAPPLMPGSGGELDGGYVPTSGFPADAGPAVPSGPQGGSGEREAGISGGGFVPDDSRDPFGGGAATGAGQGTHAAVFAGDGPSTTTYAAVGDSNGDGAVGKKASGAVASGGMPMGGMGRMDSGEGNRRGRRAAYLVEDEETWRSAIPEFNPAVIE